MRIAISVMAAVVAVGSASQAYAADAPMPLGLAVSAATHDPLASAPLVEARFGRTDARPLQKTPLIGDQFTADAPLRHRIGSQMMEYYPVANSGFHLSGGARLFNITNFRREADKLTNNLLWSPTNNGFSGIRTGFARKTPAMTVGYTQTVAKTLAFGLEAGTLLGRANANMPHELARTLGQVGAEMRMNPIAALVVGMKF